MQWSSFFCKFVIKWSRWWSMIQVYKPRPNGSNMLRRHRLTLLNPTCCTRLSAMLRDVACCWMVLNEVLFPSNIVFNIIQRFFCSQLWTKVLHWVVWPSCSILLNACMPTKLTCDYLYPWQWFTGYGCLGVATWMLRYGMANEESATVPTPFHGQHKAVGKIKKLEKLFPSVYIACTRGVVGAPCWGFELKSAARPFLFSSF